MFNDVIRIILVVLSWFCSRVGGVGFGSLGFYFIVGDFYIRGIFLEFWCWGFWRGWGRVFIRGRSGVNF